MKNPLIVIAGPTASGKTSLSVNLAKKINGEIISADSMQVYKYMDIGTAKIREHEMEGVKHYLVDELYPDEEFNINIFQKEVKKAIEEIRSKGKIPILVGGTGFYIQSIVYDIDFQETDADIDYRNELEQLANEKGNTFIHNMLREVDEVSANKIHENNVKRVIRALEFYKQTGTPISKHNEEEQKKSTPYNLLFYVLNMDRAVLYERIDKRVDIMINEGLVEEVKKLKDLGYSKDLVSMKGLGYKEIIDYLDGKFSLEESIYILKRDTRHFAKRQLTWFKREKEAIWLNVTDYSYSIEKILKKIIKDVEEKQLL
jgi:tRNA dimethylallyltransferase